MASGGSGFATRMTVLVGIMAACLGIWGYDKYVQEPNNLKKVDILSKLVTSNTRDGGGIPNDQVHDELKTKPVESFEVKSDDANKPAYFVEHFKFSRTIPLMPGGVELYVVYDMPKGGNGVKSLKGFETSKPTYNVLQARYKLDDGTGHEVNRDFMPSVAGAGGGGGGGKKKSKKADPPAEEKSADDQKADDGAGEEKKADEAAGGATEEKKEGGDGQSGETKKDDGTAGG